MLEKALRGDVSFGSAIRRPSRSVTSLEGETLTRYFQCLRPAPLRFTHRPPTNLPTWFPADNTRNHEGAKPATLKLSVIEGAEPSRFW